jgi:hypothetical protein
MDNRLRLIEIASASGAAWFGSWIYRFPERFVKLLYGDINAELGENPILSLHATRRCGEVCFAVSLFILLEILLEKAIPNSIIRWRSTIVDAPAFFLAFSCLELLRRQTKRKT